MSAPLCDAKQNFEHRSQILGNTISDGVLGDASIAAVERTELPIFASSDDTVKQQSGAGYPMIKGDEFDGQLRESANQVGLLGFNDREVAPRVRWGGADDLVIDHTTQVFLHIDRIFNINAAISEVGNLEQNRGNEGFPAGGFVNQLMRL